jgi:MarR family transcriptional regulator for hemolysin
MGAVSQSQMPSNLPALEACPDCLRGNLGWLLGQAHYAFVSELAKAFEPLGLTPRSHFVLSAAMTGARTQKQLADLIGLDKTTMVVTLDELEAAGLARRAPSPGDRRARVIEVTEAGAEKVAQAVAIRVQREILGSLGGPEGDALLRALSELVTGRLGDTAVIGAVRRREPRA